MDARVTHDPDPLGPVEPLAESAPLAWAMSPRLCRGDHAADDCCVWYHRVWQYLRLLGIVSTIRVNTDFLIKTFQDLAHKGDYPAVLVSGTADYGMLAHLTHAYRGHDLDVTVLDRCESSLFINRWYADRFDVTVKTICGDVLEYAAERPFDLVCTHNFLGRFDSAARQRLAARWHALLRPGGVVVTTQQIKPNFHPESSALPPDQAWELSARVVAAAAAHPSPLGVDLGELGQAVYEFGIRKRDHTMQSMHEVTDAFDAAGFEIVLADQGGGKAERDRDRRASKHGPGSYRMRLIARKP